MLNSVASSLSREPSRLFGDRFPYVIDGKRIMREICESFANEFNQLVLQELGDRYTAQRVARWNPLAVTSAYPTTKDQCPRIAIVRENMQSVPQGIGQDIDRREMVSEAGETTFRIYRGRMVTDTLKLSICAINENLRDDIFIWLQQYLMDAVEHVLPQLSNVYEIQCSDAVDDQVEYQGQQGQPGFEFYVGQLTCRVRYDLIQIQDVDQLKAIVNWQQCLISPDYL
jgi:hypothetical protein